MKRFLRTLLAVICGILILDVITFAIIGGIASSAGSSKTVVPKVGALKIDMSKIVIDEQMNENLDFSALQRGPGQRNIKTIGLLDAVNAVEAAAADPGVKYIYLKPDGSMTNIANLYEFRQALVNFRSSGKPIVAYVEQATTAGLYLASVADKVYMTDCQGGTPTFSGISVQMRFLGDLLKAVGVNVQLIRHGKYKSAGEMYTRGSSSPENRHQYEVMVASLWNSVKGEIAASRSMTPEKLDALIDNLELCLPEDFVKGGLADELVDRGALEDKLCTLSRVKTFDDVVFIPFDGYADVKKVLSRSSEKIAVIYANGSIVDGYDPMNVDGDRFASMIESARKDSSVKAVVLRVNSPGGSVVASEKIKTELDLLKEVKPLVASYGAYAASGGYWISNNADKIFSDPVTLTGSIGVFGLVPEFSEVYKKAKVGVESVASNKHGDMLSLSRPFTKEERAYMQRSIEAIYTKFVSIVADGRSMTPAAVDEIAQGRVWAGTDALGIGLVDQIGTLQDALAWAAVAAGNADVNAWTIQPYPEPLGKMDSLMAMFNQEMPDFSISMWTKWFENWKNGKAEYAFARMPYEITVR